MRFWCVMLATALAALAGPRARAGDFCSTCELQVGVGGAFHPWGYNHSPVIPLTFKFDRNRWEFAVFRFTNRQEYYSDTFGDNIVWARPYWGFAFSRRVEFFRYQYWRVFVGLGAGYRSEVDRQIASVWNFAEQGGLRLTPRKNFAIELAYRHFSNGGLKKPNHGQDFATLTFSVYPTLFR
jgi:hypothetical protein